MKIKNLLLIVLSLVLLVALAACDSAEKTPVSQPEDEVTETESNDETAAEDSENAPAQAVPFDPVAGELVDAGNIRAICPEGWISVPVRNYLSDDLDAVDPDALSFYKGAEDSLVSTPYIVATFYGIHNELTDYETQKMFFDAVDDIEPFMIGTDIWEGISYNLGDSITEAIISKRGYGAFDVMIRLEGGGETISFTDADVQTILTSIEY